MKNGGPRIGRVDARNHAKAAAFGRLVGGIQYEVEGGFDVVGGQRTAVVEKYAGFQMKNVG